MFNYIISLLFSLLLVGLSFFFSGNGAFAESLASPVSLAISLAGSTIVFMILSCWIKVWVAPILCVILSVLSYIVISLTGVVSSVSLLTVGMYSLLAGSAVWFAKRKLALFGISGAAIPGFVCFALPFIVEVIFSLFIQPVGAGSSILVLLIGSCCGLVYALLTLLVPASFRDALMVGGSLAGVEHSEAEVSEQIDSVAFPNGDVPQVSVLDAKLGAIRAAGSKGAGTRHKMLAED